MLTFRVRSGTSDAEVIWLALAVRPHLPEGRPNLVWDLGANIGVTMAHFAVSYPNALVVGVEPDPANAALASVNLARWAERCS